MSQPIRRQGGHLVFPIGPKNTNVLEDTAIFCIAVSEDKSKMSQPIRGQGGHLVFLIGPKNTNLVGTLRFCFLSSFVEFRAAVSEEKSNMSQPIRRQGGHLVFPIGPKNTNLVEYFEISLPVKFC